MIISTCFHLLNHVIEHIIFEHINKLMSIPLTNLKYENPKNPLEGHTIYKETNANFESFQYNTYNYELCTIDFDKHL